MLNDLKEIISIKSVMGSPLNGAPFGLECRRALDWFINKAKSYGLTAGESDGYCGFAEYGEGKLMGILCHLDVVPAGDGWTNPPYSLINEDGYLYGRGVVDNKGPAVIALHVIKALKDNNIKLNHRVRVIVGCNEENGSLCMKHYYKNCEIPEFSIVPDSDFPVINSEKGIAHLQLDFPSDDFLQQSLLNFHAGQRANVVPDLCTFSVKKGCPLYKNIQLIAGESRDNSLISSPSVLKKLVAEGYSAQDFSVNFFDDRIDFECRGIAGHAMSPEKGENAFFKAIILLDALKSNDVCSNKQDSLNNSCQLKEIDDSSVLNTLKTHFATPLSAEKLSIAGSDDKSGSLTINTGIVDVNNGIVSLVLDIRLPISIKLFDVEKNILNKLPSGTKLTRLHYADNLFIDCNSKLIQTLLGVYTNITGEKSYCIQSGGGTYARELPNSVAFGATFPGTVTNIHNIDECISVENFNKWFDIYYKAVLQLDKAFE